MLTIVIGQFELKALCYEYEGVKILEFCFVVKKSVDNCHNSNYIVLCRMRVITTLCMIMGVSCFSPDSC